MLQITLCKLLKAIINDLIQTIFKAIVNTTEWELTLDLHEFDEPWMRFAKGMGCKRAFSFMKCAAYC